MLEMVEKGRFVTTSPLHPCGEPCSTEIHNETVKKADPILCNHQWNYDGIMASNIESCGNVISSLIKSKIPTYRS